MSDLHELVQSVSLDTLSDSESDSSSDGTVKEDENANTKMNDKGERAVRQTLSLRNTTIETPSSFDPILETRITTSALNNKIDLNPCGNGTSVFGNEQAFNRSVSFNLQQERASRGDNISPGPVAQRKLPIPNPATNSNPSLKGILIKPKRILPAQPDSMKMKRPLQETDAQCKASVGRDDKTGCGFGSSPEAADSFTLAEELYLPLKPAVASAIDVNRLKIQCEQQRISGNHNSAQPSHRKSLDLINTVHSNEEDAPKRSQSECRNLPQPYIVNDRSTYDVGFSKVHEWCSPADGIKMASDNSVRNLERGIRSPSPKSNATWDRSSSGYSSDERADPRSPPPISSAGTLSKHSMDSANDEREVKSEDAQNEELDQESNDCEASSKGIDDMCLTNTSPQTNTPLCEREVPSPDVCSQTIVEGAQSTRRLPVIDSGKCVCDSSSMRTNSSQMAFPHSSEITVGSKQQTLRRPAWMTALPNPSQNGGRIQYRKSGSESMISLRHPSRQGLHENTHGGLEVCGVSYKQASSIPVSHRAETASDIVAKTDIPWPDSPTPCDADFDKRVPGLVTPDRGTGTPHSDVSIHDSSAKARIIRQQFAVIRSPREMKSFNMNANVKDDNDIRKSLQNLNSPTRRSTGAKTLPVRARHTIQDTTNNQPIVDGVTSPQKQTDSDSKPGIKFFGKKMWRAPSGQPEGAEHIRPFSPFGGTLPPSKIKENEKKKQVLEVLV